MNRPIPDAWTPQPPTAHSPYPPLLKTCVLTIMFSQCFSFSRLTYPPRSAQYKFCAYRKSQHPQHCTTFQPTFPILDLNSMRDALFNSASEDVGAVQPRASGLGIFITITIDKLIDLVSLSFVCLRGPGRPLPLLHPPHFNHREVDLHQTRREQRIKLNEHRIRLLASLTFVLMHCTSYTPRF